MPIQEILKMRQSEDVVSNISIKVGMLCAPLLKAIKASNIITVTETEYLYIKKMLQGTRIKMYLLKSRNGKFILFLYRETALLNYLMREDNKAFLRNYGYEETDILLMLRRLSRRVLMYYGGKISFPHEIGIFLEYPVEDVKGFLENEGQNFKYAGYWKVYHNEQKTLRLFQVFDEKREEVVHDILLGKSIREIAV